MALIPKENLVKASNMIFIGMVLATVRFLIYLFEKTNSTTTITFIVSIGLYLVLAFFIRVGFEWARWFYFLLLIVAVLVSPFTVFALASDILAAMLYTFQLILQIYAGILMFRKRESGYN